MSRIRAAISRVTTVAPHRPQPRPPIGQTRKIAILGGAHTIRYAPFDDWTWELWSHASSRDRCRRAPDVLFDLHPPDLWRNPRKKNWDPGYYAWIKRNHIPIYMQDRYKDVPASMKYPFAQMITEFPRGYMTNQSAYMVALALMQGATQISVFGCHYATESEYGAQRGSMEYWIGVCDGRGVQLNVPPGCDLCNRPHLLYGYESHPNGKRDPSYIITWPKPKPTVEKDDTPTDLTMVDDPKCPPLMKIELEAPNPGRWAQVG